MNSPTHLTVVYDERAKHNCVSDQFRYIQTHTTPPPLLSATSHLHAKVCEEGGCITRLITEARAHWNMRGTTLRPMW